MIFKLGLTGSIGMGKTTTGNLFRNAGCRVWDADGAVHKMYQIGGKAVQPIRDAFPKAVVNGKVSKKFLRKILEENPNSFRKLEAIVHPLVAQDRQYFIESSSSGVCVFDIPLLFETGGEKNMNAVVCVIIDYETQKHRVLSRGTMTLTQFEQMLSKQLPIEEKCARADYIVTTETLEAAKQQVTAILADIEGRKNHA